MSAYTEEYTEAELEETPLVKRLRKEVADRDKILKAKDEELGKFKEQTRSQSLTQVLSDLGANPKVAKFVPSDLDVTPEAVKKWLETDGDVFGAPATTTTSTEVTTEQEPEGYVPDPEAVAELARIQAAQAAGTGGAAPLGTDAVRKTLSDLKGKGPDAVKEALGAMGLAGF